MVCPEPPVAPAHTGLQLKGWNGLRVEFNDTLEFECMGGLKFQSDFSKQVEHAICRPGNIWNTTLLNQSLCVESKYRRSKLSLLRLAPACHCSKTM